MLMNILDVKKVKQVNKLFSIFVVFGLWLILRSPDELGVIDYMLILLTVLSKTTNNNLLERIWLRKAA